MPLDGARGGVLMVALLVLATAALAGLLYASREPGSSSNSPRFLPQR